MYFHFLFLNKSIGGEFLEPEGKGEEIKGKLVLWLNRIIIPDYLEFTKFQPGDGFTWLG